MILDIVEGELCIDIDGLSISTHATYEVTSHWDGGKLTGATATLTECMRTFTAATTTNDTGEQHGFPV